MKNPKVYKIINKKTGKPISLGYASKASWRVWPSEAISSIDKPDEYFIQEYILSQSRQYDLSRNDLIDLNTASVVDQMTSYLIERKFEINAIFIQKSHVNTLLFIIPELTFISDDFLKTFSKSRELERLYNHTIEITFMGSSLENLSLKTLASDGYVKFNNL